MGGPKGWGPKKKVANIEIYVIFEVFAFCGRRTKTDFKDRASSARNENLRPLLNTNIKLIPCGGTFHSSAKSSRRQKDKKAVQKEAKKTGGQRDKKEKSCHPLHNLMKTIKKIPGFYKERFGR